MKAARAIVTAGFICAPLTPPAMYTPNVTAHPYLVIRRLDPLVGRYLVLVIC